MMNVQEPPKPATEVGDALAEGRFLFDHLVGIPRGPHPHELLRVVNLPPEPVSMSIPACGFCCSRRRCLPGRL